MLHPNTSNRLIYYFVAQIGALTLVYEKAFA